MYTKEKLLAEVRGAQELSERLKIWILEEHPEASDFQVLLALHVITMSLSAMSPEVAAGVEAMLSESGAKEHGDILRALSRVGGVNAALEYVRQKDKAPEKKEN